MVSDLLESSSFFFQNYAYKIDASGAAGRSLRCAESEE